MRPSAIALLALTSCAPAPPLDVEERAYRRGVEEVWAAAEAAVLDLDLTIDAAVDGRLEARRPDGEAVTVDVRGVEAETSTVTVRADPSLSKLILERVAARLGARGVPAR